jgi:hypothetical protein
MKHRETILVIVAALYSSLALADDFKTINGKEYKNAAVSRVEPDGLVIKFSGGIVKVPFTDLSEELRRKYNYEPEAAKAFAADVQQKQTDSYLQTEQAKREQTERAARRTPAQEQYQRKNVELKYHSPEELAERAHKAAREKMFSPEEENAELAKIPPGGALSVILYSITIDSANTKWLTYIIGNSAGEVMERRKGDESWPSYESEYSWRGFDYVELPAFDDSLRLRVYHELLGNLGDYIIHRDGRVTRER